jgi:hypothetical protein
VWHWSCRLEALCLTPVPTTRRGCEVAPDLPPHMPQFQPGPFGSCHQQISWSARSTRAAWCRTCTKHIVEQYSNRALVSSITYDSVRSAPFGFQSKTYNNVHQLIHVRRSMKLVCQSFLSASAVRGTETTLPALPGVDGVFGVFGRPMSGGRAKDLYPPPPPTAAYPAVCDRVGSEEGRCSASGPACHA